MERKNNSDLKERTEEIIKRIDDAIREMKEVVIS